MAALLRSWPWSHIQTGSRRLGSYITVLFSLPSGFFLEAYSLNIRKCSNNKQHFLISGPQCVLRHYLLMLWALRLLDVIEEKEHRCENTCLYKLNLLSLTDMQLVRHAAILQSGIIHFRLGWLFPCSLAFALCLTPCSVDPPQQAGMIFSPSVRLQRSVFTEQQSVAVIMALRCFPFTAADIMCAISACVCFDVCVCGLTRWWNVNPCDRIILWGVPRCHLFNSMLCLKRVPKLCIRHTKAV